MWATLVQGLQLKMLVEVIDGKRHSMENIKGTVEL